jgi:hypothetical protein
MCTADGGTFNMGGCPTANRLAGQCVAYCGQPNEWVGYQYAGAPSDTQTFCMSAKATYVP